MKKNSGTANEVLGISPSELTGMSVDEIKACIRTVQDGMSEFDRIMTEDDIDKAAEQILIDAQEDEEDEEE